MFLFTQYIHQSRSRLSTNLQELSIIVAQFGLFDRLSGDVLGYSRLGYTPYHGTNELVDLGLLDRLLVMCVCVYLPAYNAQFAPVQL